MTPLQRYLKRQREAEPRLFEASATPSQGRSPDRSPDPSPVGHSTSGDERQAIEGGAPALPPLGPAAGGAPAPTGPAAEPSVAAAAVVPAGFLVRALAALVDAMILRILASLVATVLFFFPYWESWFATTVLWFTVSFFYFGWFYSERGATPGKMILSIELIETGTGRRIGYWRAFLRETLGKFLSAMIFFIGYLMVLFRSDKRALHDLIFDTRVIRRRDGVSPRPGPAHAAK